MWRVSDSGTSSLLSCNSSAVSSLYSNGSCLLYAVPWEAGLSRAAFGSATPGAPDSIAAASIGSTVFATNGSGVAQLDESPAGVYGPVTGVPAAATRIFGSYDGLWTAIATGSTVDLFYNLASGAGSILGSATGTTATIVSPSSPPL